MPQGKKGEGARRGAERRIIRLAPEMALLYQAEAKKRGKSAGRLQLYRVARTIGEFFSRHPGSEGEAAADLTNDLKRGLCATVPPLGPCDFDSVGIDQVGRARVVLAAAARGRAPDARAAVVGVVGPAAPGHELSDAEMLRSLYGVTTGMRSSRGSRRSGWWAPWGRLRPWCPMERGTGSGDTTTCSRRRASVQPRNCDTRRAWTSFEIETGDRSPSGVCPRGTTQSRH